MFNVAIFRNVWLPCFFNRWEKRRLQSIGETEAKGKEGQQLIVQLNDKPANNFLHRMRRKVEWRNHAQRHKRQEWGNCRENRKGKRNGEEIVVSFSFCWNFTILYRAWGKGDIYAKYKKSGTIRGCVTCVALTMKSRPFFHPVTVRGFSLLSLVITRKMVISCVNGVASDDN